MHRNIFSALKLNDPTLKIIASQNIPIDTLLQLPDGTEYTSTFSDIIKCPKPHESTSPQRSNSLVP